MSEIFKRLRDIMIDNVGSENSYNYIIRGLWKTELYFKPTPSERLFHYVYLLAQTIGQGCCYSNVNPHINSKLIGVDSRELINDLSCQNIAILDSIFSNFPNNPQCIYNIEGSSIDKANKRNEIILLEAENLLKNNFEDKAQIVNVGVVGDLIYKLKARGYAVCATDLDINLVGKTIHNITVKPGSTTNEFVKDSDLAIITGMTLATDTLDSIVETAKDYNTKLLMFAETGANFSELYVNEFGIDVVISEPFPFHVFQGVSKIAVYKKSENADL